jgi:uncharacterized protein
MKRKLVIAASLLSLIAIICIAYGFFIEPNRLLANTYEIKIKNWNKAFDNYKIVAISDIHGGSNFIDEAKIRKVVQLANEQNADLIVLLGDYVSETLSGENTLKMPVSTIAENLRGLKAKDGVFAVLGNHDGLFSNQIVKAEIEKVGYKVLEDEVVFINRGGEKFRIFGLIDHLSIRLAWHPYAAEMKRILELSEQTGDVVVLQHSPDILQVINGDNPLSKDFKLMLSGHTHGGQVWLPIIGTPMIPSGYGQKYAKGLIDERGVKLFVTSGIGTSLLPVRFGVPPEISVLTIKSE